MLSTIQDRFRASRLSIKALSDRAGTPYFSTWGLVGGTSDARLSTVAKVCEVLGLELRPKRGR